MSTCLGVILIVVGNWASVVLVVANVLVLVFVLVVISQVNAVRIEFGCID